MKKLMFIMGLCLMVTVGLATQAIAEYQRWEWTGWLEKSTRSDQTTITTVASNFGDTQAGDNSGVSILVLSGHAIGARDSGVSTLTGTDRVQYWQIQVVDVDVSDAQITAGKKGNYSGVSFTMVAYESNVNSPTHWAKATPTWISGLSGVALNSGASVRITTPTLTGTKYTRFGFFSEHGATAFGRFQVSIVGIRDE